MTFVDTNYFVRVFVADSYIIVAAERAGADSVATFNAKHFSKLGAVIYNP